MGSLAAALRGPRPARAWRLLQRRAHALSRRGAEEPRAWTREVLTVGPYLHHSLDPVGDALLHRAHAFATDAPELGALSLAIAARAAQRGELGRASVLLRRARVAGADPHASDVLDAHLSVRIGALPRARRLLGDGARDDVGMRLQHAFLLLAEGAHGDAGAELASLSATESPLMRGAATFFRTESAVRRRAWSEVLPCAASSRAELGFLGPKTHDVVLAIWEARALRHLGRPDLARRRAAWAFEAARDHSIGEGVVEATVELVLLCAGDERRRWLAELAMIRESTARPEVRELVAELLVDEPEVSVVDLRSRVALSRIVDALEEATVPLDVEAVFRAGWPDDSIRVESRRARVYTAVWELRRLGVPVKRGPEGYVLAAPITRR